MAILTWLGVPGERPRWEALAFEVSDDVVTVGRVACEVSSEIGWGFDELHADASVLGVPTRTALAPAEPSARGSHPNLVDRVDHVVYAVADLDDAIVALTDVLGDPPRRRFHPRGPDGPEMAFFRTGEGFIEVVASGRSDGRPPALFGIAFNSPDLDATVAAMRSAGGPVGDPKPAVQGGRIASVWKGHVGYPIAIMEPPK